MKSLVNLEQADIETEALIRRCQQGDGWAVEALVRRYQDYVYRLCYLVMRNEQDAEDMTQETFIRVCRALPRFQVREGASFEAWLYRIAVNCCRSRMRHKGYQSLPWPDSNSPAIAEERPDRLVIQGQERDEILREINALGEKHRLVIILRYYAGLSNEEIAQALDIPSGTVRSRLHMARQRLKEMLMANGERVRPENARWEREKVSVSEKVGR